MSGIRNYKFIKNIFYLQKNQIPRTGQMVYACKVQGGGDIPGQLTFVKAINNGYQGLLVGRPTRAKYAGKGCLPKKPQQNSTIRLICIKIENCSTHEFSHTNF